MTANTQRDRTDGRADEGVRTVRTGRAARRADWVPWRVEGARPSDGRSLQRPRLFRPRFWLLLLGLLTSVLG